VPGPDKIPHDDKRYRPDLIAARDVKPLRPTWYVRKGRGARGPRPSVGLLSTNLVRRNWYFRWILCMDIDSRGSAPCLTIPRASLKVKRFL